MAETIEPIFEYIPCFYINDYYNRKGYRLVGLYDELFKLKGYASDKGRTYFKD